MARAKQKRQVFKQSDLRGFKYFDSLWPMLERLERVGTERDKAGNRKLFFDQYVVSLLLYFFNPVITRMCGLQQASDLDKVRKVLGISTFHWDHSVNAPRFSTPNPCAILWLNYPDG